MKVVARQTLSWFHPYSIQGWLHPYLVTSSEEVDQSYYCLVFTTILQQIIVQFYILLGFLYQWNPFLWLSSYITAYYMVTISGIKNKVKIIFK